ncbi:uncharacterized protein TNCV_1887651 [Trichonephila clavipes]|nr:uncharacterized protein TNCV_1887651 [Trichonephila clavipes]
MWFQHDGAPAYFSAVVRSALDTTCLGRWIGRGGPVNWPARSLDLSCLDLFVWGRIKCLFYTSPVNSDEALFARISVVAGVCEDCPGYLLMFDSPSAGGIVRVHYFVRGGFVGYRSRASSKHLSPHLPVDELDSSGSNRGCVAPANARVGVGSTKKAD